MRKKRDQEEQGWLGVVGRLGNPVEKNSSCGMLGCISDAHTRRVVDEPRGVRMDRSRRASRSERRRSEWEVDQEEDEREDANGEHTYHREEQPCRRRWNRRLLVVPWCSSGKRT